MRELGPEEDRLHEEVGSFVAKQGISHFIACGKFGRNFAHGARVAGMSASKISLAKTVSDAARTLKGLVSRGDVILLKASRGGQDRASVRVSCSKPLSWPSEAQVPNCIDSTIHCPS